MPESTLHKKASKLPRAGGELGQPFGEPIKVADDLPSNTSIKHGQAKRLRPDHRVLSTDGILVAVEYRLSSPVSQEKLNRLMAEQIPVLEIDLRQLASEPPSESEIIEYIAREGSGLNDDSKRFLYMPPIGDIVKRAGGVTFESGTALTYGTLRCLVGGCRAPVANGHGGIMYRPQLRMGKGSWSYDELFGSGLRLNHTLPRFACREHMIQATESTVPGGRNWVNTPAEPDTARLSVGQSTVDMGGVQISAKFETSILGPKS